MTSNPLGRTSPAGVALDGLRGLAALMVVASHSSGMGMHLLPGLSLEGIGKHGVYLFFAISAYLLTAQWLAAAPADRLALRTWIHYLRRRVLRIYPLYTLVLLIGWALWPRGLGVPLNGAAVWRHLSLQAGQSIYWSVPVEFFYYLLIPPLVLALATRLPRTLRALGLVLLLAMVLWRWPSTQAPAGSITLGYYLPVFLCGSAAAWIQSEIPRHFFGAGQGLRAPPPALRWLCEVALLLALLATVPAISAAGGGSLDPDRWHRSFFAWGVFWGVVLLALQGELLPSWAALLRTRLLSACGRWSFGLYLLHLPVLLVIKHLSGSGLAKAWLGLLVSTLLAALVYRWVERPAQRLA